MCAPSMLRLSRSDLLKLTMEQRQQVVPLLRTSARDLYTVRRQATLSSLQHVRSFYAALEPIRSDETDHGTATASGATAEDVGERLIHCPAPGDAEQLAACAHLLCCA